MREMAEAIGVARAVVAEAYRQLSEAGLVAGEVGRGTTVLPSPDSSGQGGPLSAFAQASLVQTQEMAGAPALPAGQELVADFAELAPDAAGFPVEEVRLAMDRVLAARGAELLGYGHAAAGIPELRDLLCQRSRREDPNLSPDDILVTAEAQQGRALVLRTFCAQGDAVVLTSPCYHQMFGLLKAHGLRAVEVPFVGDGLDLGEFARAMQRKDVRLCYLMPSFHNPTGRTLSEAHRRELVAIAADTEVPILEDEYQDALRFRGAPPPSLRTLDPRGLTVTVHTFSKGLFPGLRVGWVLGGARAMRPMAAVKRFVDLETSPLLQAVLCEFISAGGLDRHLRALAAELRQRHAALQDALASALPEGCALTSPDGGFVVWLELPQPGQGDRLAELAAQRGVRVVPGRAFDPQGRPSRGVRLSLSHADCARIRAGAEVLLDLAQELVRGPSAVAARNFL